MSGFGRPQVKHLQIITPVPPRSFPHHDPIQLPCDSAVVVHAASLMLPLVACHPTV